MNFRNWKIGQRIYGTTGVLVLFILVLIGTFSMVVFSVEEIAKDYLGEELLKDQKQKLKVSTNTLALSLAEVTSVFPSAEEQAEHMNKAIKNIKYEEDKSGYFFIFEGTVGIVHPTLKGKDAKDVKDPNGVQVLQELYNVAKEGGGFVSYIWKKGDQGDQPKISYATMIPGTNYWVGTGIYVDNIETQKASVVRMMHKKAMTLFLWVVGVVIVILTLFILPSIYYVILSITKPIAKIVAVANKLSTGAIDVDLTVEGKDEVSAMEHSFSNLIHNIQDKTHMAEVIANKDLTNDVVLASNDDVLGKSLQAMQASLRELITQIKESSMEIDTGSENLSSLGDSLSSSASQQAASVEEISSSMEEVNNVIQNSAGKAGEADQLAQKQMQDAQDGVTSMKELESAISEIHDSNNEIVKIVSVIDNISFQTNLLALNAAVEAARAGQHGKGFAVVADEVRTLANRSAIAAKEVAALIKKATDKVERGTEASASTAAILGTIGDGAESVAHTLQEIKESAEFQANSIKEINAGMTQITDTTQDNAASAEESAASALDLSHQANLLKEIVTTFRL